MKKTLLLLLLLTVLLSACGTAPAQGTTVQPAIVLPTNTAMPLSGNLSEISTPVPNISAAADVSPTPRPTLAPDAWMSMPVVPEVSDTARAIYQRGQEMGNDPHVFSRIGDCQNVASRFLGVFDSPGDYTLGDEYAYLQETIDYFAGSFVRQGFAVKGGYNVAAILSPLRADKENCEAGESPVACEIRANNPSFAIISLEEWWANKPADEYEKYLRQIVEYTIDKGVVPILATKADNLEGDNGINQAIARVAYDYDIPLWNFWAAVQPLPNHGLEKEFDGFHLSFSGDAGNQFDDPYRMEFGWAWRNLTALQSLDAVRRGVTEQNP